MYPFWPLSGALQLPKWCMLITEMAHPIYRISGALTLPKSGALSVTDYNIEKMSMSDNCQTVFNMNNTILKRILYITVPFSIIALVNC